MIGADIATYAVALAVAAAIPGPGITALVARSVGSGASAGFAMLSGLILGDLIYLTFAVFGLAIIAQSFGSFFTVIRWASIAYLLFLAWQFWTAKRHELDSETISAAQLGRSAVAGFALTLGNPKTIAFYLALLPLVLDLNSISLMNWATVLVPVTVCVLIIIGGGFIVGALAIRRILSGAKAQQRLHRGAAVAMAGAAGTLIFREL